MVNKTVIYVEPEKQEILITKELNATLDLVFQDCTDSKLYFSCLNREDSQKHEEFQPKNGESNIQFDKVVKALFM